MVLYPIANISPLWALNFVLSTMLLNPMLSRIFPFFFSFLEGDGVKPKIESCKSRPVSAYFSSLSFLDNRAPQLRPHPPPFLSIRLRSFSSVLALEKLFCPIVESNTFLSRLYRMKRSKRRD